MKAKRVEAALRYAKQTFDRMSNNVELRLFLERELNMNASEVNQLLKPWY